MVSRAVVLVDCDEASDRATKKVKSKELGVGSQDDEV